MEGACTSDGAESWERRLAMAQTTLKNPDIWKEIMAPSRDSPLRPRLLFVEDKTRQAKGVTDQIGDEWLIGIVKGAEEAWQRLEEMNQSLSRLDQVVISIDLGLEPSPDKPDEGLKLLKRIRRKWEGVRVIVHTGQKSHPVVVKQVIAEGASYIHLDDDDDSVVYAGILQYILDGYIVLSPSPAGKLRELLAVRPDPFVLNPEYWDTLGALYSTGGNQSRASSLLKIGAPAVNGRVKKILDLIHLLYPNELPTNDNDNVPYEARVATLLRWYEQHRDVYGR